MPHSESPAAPRTRRRFGKDAWLTVAVALACAAALNATVWSLSIPPGQAPDEPTHFAVAKFTADHGRIPEFGVDPGMGINVVDPQGTRVGNYSYAGTPQLPYVLDAAFIALPTDTQWMDYRQGRLTGALWLAATVLLTYLLARRMTGSGAVAASAAALTAAWPQLTFVNAYVNTDGFTVMAGVALMWSWWRGAQERWRARDAAVCGAMIGLAAQGKFTGYVLIALTLVVLAVTLRGPARYVVNRLAIGIGSALVVCSWWLVSAFRLYGTDIYATHRASELAKTLDLGSTSGHAMGQSLWGMLTAGHWLDISARSAVGTFGWMSLPLSGWLYLMVAAVVIMGIIGALVALPEAVRHQRDSGRRTSWLTALTLSPILLMPALSARNSWLNDFQAQGRYLFAGLVPLLVVVAWGLSQLGKSEARSRGLLVVGAGILLLTNILALTQTVLHGYQTNLSSWWGHWQAGILVLWIIAGTSVVVATVIALCGPRLLRSRRRSSSK